MKPGGWAVSGMYTLFSAGVFSGKFISVEYEFDNFFFVASTQRYIPAAASVAEVTENLWTPSSHGDVARAGWANSFCCVAIGL